MMNSDNIDVLVVYPICPEMRLPAARLYQKEFAKGLRLFIGTGEPAVKILSEALNLDMAVGAVVQARLVGIVGLQHDGRRFIELRWGIYRKEFGLVQSALRYAACVIFSIPRHWNFSSGSWALNGTAVDREFRCRGIGRLLISAVVDLAARSGTSSVYTTVYCRNRRALSMFKGAGFRPTGVISRIILTVGAPMALVLKVQLV